VSALHAYLFAPAAAGDDDGHVGPRRSRDSHDARDTDSTITAEDRALLDRLRAGDDTAFRTIFDARAESLADFAYGYLRSRAAAQDVVQDVLAKLWTGRATLEIRTSLRSYLYQAVRHRALNAAKRDQVAARWAGLSEAERAERLSSDVPPVIRALLDDPAFVAALDAALHNLPPRMREVIALVREHGLTPSEAAHTLGISVSTVYNTMAQAVKRLAHTLHPWRVDADS
jgi:RNA polymerase sigma factor (sigma-70 family)